MKCYHVHYYACYKLCISENKVQQERFVEKFKFAKKKKRLKSKITWYNKYQKEKA